MTRSNFSSVTKNYYSKTRTSVQQRSRVIASVSPTS